MGTHYLRDFIQDNHYRINKYINEINHIESILTTKLPDLVADIKVIAKINLNNKSIVENKRLQLSFENLQKMKKPNYFNKNWVGIFHPKF